MTWLYDFYFLKWLLFAWLSGRANDSWLWLLTLHWLFYVTVTFDFWLSISKVTDFAGSWSLLNYKQVFSSNLDSFIKVLEYLFKSYNTKIIQEIKSAGYRVQGLTGQAFLDEVFKIGRVFFNMQLNLTMTQFLNAKKFIQQRILLTTSFCLEFYKRSPKKLPSYFDKKPPIKTVHHISKKINQATATMFKTEEILPSFEIKCIKNSQENELTDCYENMLLRLSNLEIKMLKKKGLDMESYNLILQRIAKMEQSLESADSSQNFNFSVAEFESLSNRINSLPLS